MPPEPVPVALSRAAASKDLSTFARAVVRYRGLIASVIARAVGSRYEAEDLVQDVMLDAITKRESLRDPSRLKSWLARVALNRARSWGRHHRVELKAMPRIARTDATRPDLGVEREEERVRLREALARLPEATQTIIRLRYTEGLSAPEIGQRLGASPEAIRMRLSRALQALRKELVRS